MNYKGIELDLSRDALFSEQGSILASKFYQGDEASIQKSIAKAAYCFSYGDVAFAQRIYDYASKHWFFYSSPIFSNSVEGYWVDTPTKEEWHSGENISKKYWKGEEPKAMPIACFLGMVGDSIKSQVEINSELSHLSVLGGGTAVHSAIRAISDKAPGPIPWIVTVDGIMGYYRQGKTRRGSAAIYLDVSHPDIEEFIRMRHPSGGDVTRKILNRSGVHLAVNITDAFREAVLEGKEWELVCPHSKEVRSVVDARTLFAKLLEARELTGEPYIYFLDVAREAFPEYQRALGLENHGSNLCSEITLATSEDRTAVCCLSSVNLEYYNEWKDTQMIQDLIRFLDNVIQWFVDWAPDTISKAVASARAERAIGLGAMGWHNFLMKNSIPFESGGFNSAASWNYRIFSDMKSKGVQATKLLAVERGEPNDCKGQGVRNSHLFAIAPNANSSVLCNTSPSIEPIMSNAYPQKMRAGIFLIKNRFLEPVLEKYGMNTEEWWSKIKEDNGSVQNLPNLSDHEKLVFKTAYEIDQRWLIEHAGNRQEHICQGQSLNVFFAPGSSREYILAVHLKALKERKVKALYYMRTGSAQAADNVKAIQRAAIQDWKQDQEGCLSCEG